MFNQAQWLWKSKSATPNTYGWFFKEFQIDEDIQKAIIRISAHNHMKLLINGKLISGYVSPAPSYVEKEKLFLEYDITHDLLKGRNKIDVIVLYLGGSGQNYRNGIPGFILEAQIMTLHKMVEIVSDRTWLCYDQTPYKDDMPYQQSRRITAVEHYDATISLDVNKTSCATELNGYPNYQKQRIPEGGVHEIIRPIFIHQCHNAYVYDCTKIVSGFPLIQVRSSKIVTLKVRYSEDLHEQRVKHNVANEYSEMYYDLLTVPADQNIQFSPNFTYKAFRYFEIEGEINLLSELNVSVIVASTNIHILGGISSKSYPIMNDLNSMFQQTQHNNVLGLIVDCPHREQAQYLGDSTLQAESIISSVYERKELIEKVLNDFMHAQYSDGTFPFVAPGSTGITDFSIKIPEYDLYFIHLLYQRYQIDYSADILHAYHSVVKKLIEHYRLRLDHHYLVRKTSDWHISDWPYPSVDHSGNYLTYENMLFYRSVNEYIIMYKTIDDMSDMIQMRDSLRNSIVTLLKHNGKFKDHEDSIHFHQGIQAFGLENDLFESYEIENVLDYIVSLGVSSSIILSKYVIEQLFRFHREKAALSYIFDDNRGWGHIIRSGSQTMWEGFDDIESHSHAWGLYPIRLIQEYLMGIPAGKSVDETWLIKPQFTDMIKDLSVSVITDKGILSLSYVIEGNHVHFRYNIPKNMDVLLCINKQSIRLNGSDKLSIII